MIKKGIKTADFQKVVTIAIDRNQPPVVIIAEPISTCNNYIPEPQDTGNILTGVDFIISEIQMNACYDLKIKRLNFYFE